MQYKKSLSFLRSVVWSHYVSGSRFPRHKSLFTCLLNHMKLSRAKKSMCLIIVHYSALKSLFNNLFRGIIMW